MGFPRQEYWSVLPFPSQKDPPDPGIEPMSSVSPAVQVDSLHLSLWGSPNTLVRTFNQDLDDTTNML